jgi:hypothetical protein
LGDIVVVLLDEEVFQNRDQQRAETRFPPLDLCEPVLGDEFREKRLRQITSIPGSFTTPANERINRIPIVSTKVFLCGIALWLHTRALDHDRPARGQEPAIAMGPVRSRGM